MESPLPGGGIFCELTQQNLNPGVSSLMMWATAQPEARNEDQSDRTMDGYLLDLQHLDSFQKWALICAGAMTVLYLVMRPFNKKRKDPLKPSTKLSLAGQREVERQMTELLVELEKMARQMTAQLDTRAAKLELLIKEADQRISQLQGNAQLTSTAASTCEQVPQLPPASESPVAPSFDPRHAQVYELADAGQSAREVAQHLGRPQGEIELILALRSRMAVAASS